MNGLIMEIGPSYAVVMTQDGGFEKWEMDTEALIIGQEVEKPKSKSPVVHLRPFRYMGKKRVLQVAASLMIAFMLSGTGAWAYYTPYGYINIDINPSVELTYNRFERVIDMKSLNTDGAIVLDDVSGIKNKSISEAIEQVVLNSDAKGYMTKDENLVLVTVTPISDSGDDVSTQLKAVETWAQAEAVTLENRESDLDNYEAASKDGVSPGKKLLVEEAKRILREQDASSVETAPSDESPLDLDEKSNLGQIMKIIRSKESSGESRKPEKEPDEKKPDKTPPGQEKKRGSDSLTDGNDNNNNNNNSNSASDSKDNSKGGKKDK